LKKTKKAVNKHRGDIMRKIFMCSLCHNGVLGGTLYLENDSLTYRTNKLTVDKKYRNLVMPLNDINDVSWNWFIFPIATFNMKNGDKYKVMIYNKSRFVKAFAEHNWKTEG
jgi:hypothetical protein